jgi:signal peptidase I
MVELVKTVVVALLIALVLRTLVFQPFTIPSDSMEPTLLRGDYLLVSKFSYGWSRCSLSCGLNLFHGRIGMRQPHRGDIIVFQLPHQEKETLIKRLIGLPGDTIQVMDGVLYLNGKAIPHVTVGQTNDPDAPDVPVTEVRETMPGGPRYITFHRGPGHDGEDTDPYVVPAGHYFFMGDNRDNSLDSRWPAQLGGVDFVPAEDLVGKAQIVLASWKGGVSMLQPWTWVQRFDFSRLIHPLH